MKRFPEQKRMTREDLVIILGDFGGIWKDSPEERYWLDWLNDRPFTLCFLDGNHENFDRYYRDGEFETVDFHGGRAHRIREHIFHLMRGYVFELEGKKFFCMGGARSHDIEDGILEPADYPSREALLRRYHQMERQRRHVRVNHLSWWKEELPSEEEMTLGRKSLDACHYEVDYVLTHCLPQQIASAAGLPGSDPLMIYFNHLLLDGLRFTSWWCGHYHCDMRILGKFHILYERMERLLPQAP